MNLTFASQSDQSEGYQGTGFANMFEVRRPIDFAYDFTYGYNFDAALSGTAYSICVLPGISSVSPSTGSFGGGTLLTINGFGFPRDASALRVYAGKYFSDNARYS
jgi:hypothetical protein